MSIITCPGCGKKISSLAAPCPHCGFQPGEASDEQMLLYRQRRARDRVYYLSMTSYVVITVFVAAFGWYWWQTGGFRQTSSPAPFIVMEVSAVSYLVVRGLLYQARRKQKQLRRKVV